MSKVTANYEIQSDQQEWLDKIVKEFDLPDASKALRVLLDYAIEDGDESEIFAPQNARCRHCG